MNKHKLLNIILLLVWLPVAALGQWYYGSGEATNIENVIGYSTHDQKIVANQAGDPSSAGYAAGEGSLYLQTLGNLWIKTGAADTTWNKLSTLDAAKPNVGTFAQFDADVVLASTWETAGLSLPTFAEETTNHLSGAKSYKLTNGPNVADFIESPDVTVPLRSKSKYIAAVFNATYDGATDDMSCYLYDVTNSAVLGAAVNIEASTASKQYTAVGYALSTTATVSFRCETLVANSGKILVFDDVVLTDDPFVYKDLLEVTDWTAFTPTGSWTANTTYTGYKRRVGDTAEYQVKLALTGAPTSANLTINIPDGTIDTGKAIGDTSDLSLGIVSYLDAGTAYVAAGLRVGYNNTTTVKVLDDNTPLDATNPITWANGDEVFINFSVPIAGWSSSTEHVVVPRTAPKQYDLTVTGTNWTTGRAKGIYYIDQTGAHRLKFNIRGTLSSLATSFTGTIVGITTISGVIQGVAVQTYNSSSPAFPASNAGFTSNGFYTTMAADANDIRISGDVELASKPTWADPVTSQYLAAIPPKVKARYSSNAGQSIANNTVTIVNFEDKEWDSHGAVTVGASWKFTAPETNYYRVSTGIIFDAFTADAGEIAASYIHKGGTNTSRLNLWEAAAGIDTYVSLGGSTTVYLLKGEYIDVRVYQNTGGAEVFNNVTEDVWITIESID